MSTATTQIIISGKDQLSGVVADAGRRLGTELQSMQRNVLSLQNAFMALAGAAALGQVRQAYSDYDASLRDMVKVTDESQSAIAAKMKAIPAELGNTTELIQGYYQVISAGITDPVKAMETLTDSVEAAKAAHLGQSDVIKGITKIMAGYAGDVKSAAEAADLLFTIEKQGQTSFAELIPVIGDVSAVSKQLGVDQTEMGAALAAVTQTAGSTSQAATQYRMMLVNLMKPTKDMREALDGIGASSGQVAIEQYGLAGTLQRLQEYAQKSGVSVAKLFESSEALLSVAALSRGEFAQYNINLQAMETRAGAADKAFREWKTSTQAVDDLFRNTMTNTLIKIGEQVMPTVNVAVQDFAEYVGQHGDEIAGVFGEMAEYGRQIGSAMVPAIKEVANVLGRDIIPAVAGVARSASDLLSLVPADYQSSVGGGLIGYALLGPKGALIGATIVGIKEALDDLWGDEAASKQGESIDRVLLAAEKRLEAAQRRLRQAEKLPGNNSSALSSAQSDIDRETALIGRLNAAKAKVAGVQKTFSDTWGEIERKSMTGVAAVAAAAPAIVAPPAAAITTLGSSAEAALAKVRGEISKLSMTEAQYEKFKISEEYAKLAKELGAANPALKEWLALKEREYRLNQAAKLEPYQITQLEQMNRGDMFFGKAAADKRGLDMLEDQGRENLQLQTEFADKYKEIVLGETAFKMEQIRLQGEAYVKGGADEVAVAQWAAQEKLAVSREWADGARRALEEYADSATNLAAGVESAVTNGFKGMEDALVDFVATGKLSFSDLADSIIRDLARIAVQQSITGPLAKGLEAVVGGMFSGGASSASLTGSSSTIAFSGVSSAKGNVFDSPGLSAYSSSIVDRPTVFPFARGIGLMGEAGPEAIMPLRRGPDGTLGVKGGGGSSVVINIIESQGKGGQQEQRRDGDVDVIDVFFDMIDTRQAQGIMNGGTKTSTAMSHVFGLNRANGALR